MHRFYLYVVVVVLLAAWSAPAHAVREVREAGFLVHVTTNVSTDTVTVGERFDITYSAEHADTLTPVTPGAIDGTCRVIDADWRDIAGPDGPAYTGRVTFIPVNIDSAYVAPIDLAFVTPDGDTLHAWTDPVYLHLTDLAAESDDLRPLKQPWAVPPDYRTWILIGAGILAAATAVLWWIRGRRARRGEPVWPAVRSPPDVAALTEFERFEAMGLVAKGEFPAYYTLVVDALRRYITARFGVEALDRTTGEIVQDLFASGHRVDGLDALLNEADLVKFAKYRPDAGTAAAAIASARKIVVATAPREAPAPAADGTVG
jgi:hypothetical protein